MEVVDGRAAMGDPKDQRKRLINLPRENLPPKSPNTKLPKDKLYYIV
jgi:hypothetical protein